VSGVSYSESSRSSPNGQRFYEGINYRNRSVTVERTVESCAHTLSLEKMKDGAPKVRVRLGWGTLHPFRNTSIYLHRR